MASKQQQGNTSTTNPRAMMPAFIFAASTLLLGACAGTPPGGTVAEDDMECIMVPVTGSRMPIRECRPRGEREAIAAAQREAAVNSTRDINLLDEAGNQSLGADSLQ